MRVILAADHSGFALKNALKEFVAGLGHDVEDAGAFELDDDDDYVPFVRAAAEKVALDPHGTRAIVIGASGQGEAMAANRLKGVRCALYYGAARTQTDMDGKTLDMVASARTHNNANALSLGARFITEEEAKEAVKKWLETPFSGAERHARRNGMLDE